MKKIITLFLLSLATIGAQAQSVILANPGNPACVGDQMTFMYPGSQSVTSWTLTPATNLTIVGSHTGVYPNNYITVKANNTSNFSVTANYGGGSSTYSGMSVLSVTTPNVGISASATTICYGQTSSTFTATPTNGGSSPSYTWYVNTTLVSGVTASTYTSNTLPNNSKVYVKMYSNKACVTGNYTTTVASPVITVNTPTPLNLVLGGTTTVCGNVTSNSSNQILFAANTTNGSPTYTWTVTRNGQTISNPDIRGTSYANTTPYIPSAVPQDGDIITCAMSSGASCTQGGTISQSLTFHVKSTTTPSVHIIANNSQHPVCDGNVATFTGAGSNEGSSPAFSWAYTHNSVTTNGSGRNYATSFYSGDAISVTLTPSADVCPSASTASETQTSTTLSAASVFYTKTYPTLSVYPTSAQPVCAGNTVPFSSSATNQGVGPTYQWNIDGTNTGSNSPAYTTDNLTAGLHQVKCTLASSITCAVTVSSAIYTVSVAGAPVIPAVNTFLGSGTITVALPVYSPSAWTLRWYNTPTSYTINSSTVTFATTGTFTYNICFYNNLSGCETPRTPVTVTVYQMADPVGITGNIYPLRRGIYNYMVSSTAAGTTYNWAVPAGSNILSGQGTSRVQLQLGTTSDYITVQASTSYGTGKTASLFLSVTDINYIRDETILVPSVLDPAVIPALPVESRLSKTTYMDGLGRDIQHVVWQQSPSKQDMVQPVAYDAYGRTPVNYLPYTTASDGDYKISWAADQPQFYTTATGIAKDNQPYAVTIFEPSPLNRTWEQGAAGTAWQPADQTGNSAGHTVKIAYQGNSDNEVRLWAYDYTTGLCTSTTYYVAGALYKTQTTDEHGNQSWECKDKEGLAVYKKIQDGANSYTEAYNIYDDFGKLRIVIPPMGVKTLQDAGNWTMTQSLLDTWCYQYKYDQKQRPIQSKIPGAAWVYTIYDNRDRVVLTQDGNQRASNAWLFKKHDIYNRPVSMGVFTYSGGAMTQPAMQAIVDGVYNNSAPRSYSVARIAATDTYTDESYPTAADGTINYLTYTYYDDYSYKNTWNSSGTAYDFVPELSNTTAFDRLTNKVTGVKTKVLTDNTWLKTVSYYDDRGRTIQTIADSYTISGANGTDRATTQYDFSGKALASQLTHTGKDNLTIRTDQSYDHAGRPVDTYYTLNNSAKTLVSHNTYNELGQLTDKQQHADYSGITGNTTSGNPCSGTTLAINTYNANCSTLTASQSITFNTGFSYVATTPAGSFTAIAGSSSQGAASQSTPPVVNFLQSIDYRYNIRGWLTSINNSQLANDNGATNDDANDTWGMNLAYNLTIAGGLTTPPQYNGNISAVKWSNYLGQATEKENAYTYTYDPLNRLKTSAFAQNTGSWNTNGNYNETINTYDKNGNIQALSRTGIDNTPAQATIDNLTYTYSGNQTVKIDDATGNPAGFNNQASNPAEYTYDPNGNMVTDQNKNITGIAYNYLNLPQQITKSDNSYILYTYDATGRKLAQQVYNSNNQLQKKTIYQGPLHYDNDSLKYIQQPEGRIVTTVTGSGLLTEYQYHHKDHLGNIRQTYTTQPGQEQSLATFESPNTATEQSQYVNYDKIRKIYSSLFDHTNGAAPSLPTGPMGYSIRLNGSSNEKQSIARTLSVMPGDVIHAEVYAKYIDDNNTTGWTTALTTLINQIAANTTGVVLDGASYPANGSTTFPYTGYTGTAGSTGSGPKAYLNWLIFDREYNYKTGGYQRLSAAAKETGSDVAFEKLQADFTVNEPGYVYIYLSNEETGSNIEAYFDDFAVTQTNSPIVQTNDYYPFGLTFRAYQRENTVKNKYLYNGKELQEDGGFNVYDYINRQFDPITGRFVNIDPAAELMRRVSPYAYAFNNPIRFTDPDGMVPGDFLNEKGENIGNDGKNDGKLYVVKTTQTEFDSGVEGAGISKDKAKQTEKFIKDNSGNTAAFNNNSGLMDNVVEIEGSSNTRQEMINVVSGDDGKGGEKSSNNREYGGTISNNSKVNASAPGTVSDPSVDPEASVTHSITPGDTKTTFHSHPSGAKIQYSGGGVNVMGGETTTTYSFGQAPSKHDVAGAGQTSEYVFGKGSGKVYIYNQNGVQGTLPIKNFVNPK